MGQTSRSSHGRYVKYASAVPAGYTYIADYVDSLTTGSGVFRTLAIEDHIRTVAGDPVMMCGNNAVVFQVVVGGWLHQLKCFLKHGEYRGEIYGYIESRKPGLLAPARLLVGEMYVWDRQGRVECRDVALAPWVEGVTLGARVRAAALNDDRETLSRLAHDFDEVMLELLAEPWAHGDLKPDNIVVTFDGELRLVDYDAMFVPALAGKKAVELGTPGWQHAGRTPEFFDKHIDDYSIALISVMLHAVALDPRLWLEVAQYNSQFLDPRLMASGNYPLLGRVRQLFVSARLEQGIRLCDMLACDTPVLPDIASVLDMGR